MLQCHCNTAGSYTSNHYSIVRLVPTMAKLVVCQTVICKVNGITLLRLDTNGQKANNARDATEEHLKFDISNGVDDEPITITAANDDNEAKEDNYDEQYEPMAQSSRNVFEMETVDTSIESVRQYVQTTRKNGKVWHQCRWNRTNSEACSYGSKWSGAMVNHIRSHLGLFHSCLVRFYLVLTIEPKESNHFVVRFVISSSQSPAI